MIADASAYLLEMSGDMEGALELMLRKLENDLVAVKTKIRMGENVRDTEELHGVLGAALDLCERKEEEGGGEEKEEVRRSESTFLPSTYSKTATNAHEQRLTCDSLLFS